MNEIEDNLVQQELEHQLGEREAVMRVADNTDRARLKQLERERVLALGKELDIPVPGTTTVSLDLAELAALRGGFVRVTGADKRLYQKLLRAETRLTERLSS